MDKNDKQVKNNEVREEREQRNIQVRMVRGRTSSKCSSGDRKSKRKEVTK